MTPLNTEQHVTAAVPLLQVADITPPEIVEISKANFKREGNSIIVSLPTNNGADVRFKIGFGKFMAMISIAAAFANLHLSQLWDAIGGP